MYSQEEEDQEYIASFMASTRALSQRGHPAAPPGPSRPPVFSQRQQPQPNFGPALEPSRPARRPLQSMQPYDGSNGGPPRVLVGQVGQAGNTPNATAGEYSWRSESMQDC